MRKIEKANKLSHAKIAIILSAILVVMATASIIIYFVTGGTEDPSKKEPPTPLEGEALYNNYLIAYPTMEEKDIQYISVENENGSFGMVRPEKDGSFTLFYKDAYGNLREFNPTIADADDNFEYSDLFAIETGDGYNQIPKLTYLCMALQLPYFEERIELIPEEREAQLDAYGLAEGEYETVKFTYLDSNGDAKTHTVKIGDKNVVGTGYYFTVDDRNYVYAGFSSYMEYALMGFYSFIKPILISGGIAEDTVISAYLTANYYQWLGEMHKAEGESVKDGANVIVFADTIVPVRRDDDFGEDSEKPSNGYLNKGYEQLEFNLADYKGKADYERLVNALVGKKLGDYSSDEILVTLTSQSLLLDFSKADTALYEYSITEIEAVINGGVETNKKGTPVADAELVKVSYNLEIDGKAANTVPLHAVIDLSSPALSKDFVSSVRAARLGEASSISFSVNYTKDNSASSNVKYVVTQIVGIYSSDGKAQSKVTSSSIVSYRYKLVVNGVSDGEEYITTVELGKSDTETDKKLSAALVGKSISKGLNILVEEYTEYYECVYDFISYSIRRIDFFVTREMISAFRFLNNSDRDPFYGESIYENTLENKYSIYGVSNAVCQEVVNIITGINTDANQPPTGLTGIETVAVGINPEVMRKFGLYAHHIYFEMPRGIFTLENDDLDEIDDYDWYDTLAFNLYISDVNEDGTRYVGSDLYDIVAKVDGDKFVFLEYGFVDFWARTEMMITDIEHIKEASFEAYLEDFRASYDMELDHKTVYWSGNGKYNAKPEGNISYSEFDEITVKVTPFGNPTSTKLTEYINKNNYDFVSLTEFYNTEILGGGTHYVKYDPYGTSNFKELIENIFYSSYAGIIPADEQDGIVQNAPMIFRMSFKLSSSAWRYVYEFYRYDDNRVMVRLYQATYDKETHTYTAKSTAVSDFYITSFTAKKLINNLRGLLDGVDIDKETPYVD